MQLDVDDMAFLSEQAIVAAEKAGALIESYASKQVEVQHKPGGNTVASQVVTEVDVLAEKAILEVLQPTCGRYDLALLSEESADDKTRLGKDYFWCIDPMDGTLSFIESTPGYAVSIALVSQAGTPVIGVIYDPVTHTLYSAVQGQGVTRNGERWIIDVTSGQDKPLTFVCDRGMLAQPYFPTLRESLTGIAIQHGYDCLEVLEKNGAVLNACYVLEHPPAVYFKCPKPQQGGGSLWDFAATAALFFELGFSATDFYGEPLDLNRVDSTYMNHRGVLFTLDNLLATDIQGLLQICKQ